MLFYEVYWVMTRRKNALENTIDQADNLSAAAREPSQTHWIFIAIVILETLLSDVYFQGWASTIVTTTTPAAFAIICGKKTHRKIGYWLLIAAFTALFWILNSRLRPWMNHLGILAIGLVAFAEIMLGMAVVVRAFPQLRR